MDFNIRISKSDGELRHFSWPAGIIPIYLLTQVSTGGKKHVFSLGRALKRTFAILICGKNDTVWSKMIQLGRFFGRPSNFCRELLLNSGETGRARPPSPVSGASRVSAKPWSLPAAKRSGGSKTARRGFGAQSALGAAVAFRHPPLSGDETTNPQNMMVALAIGEAVSRCLTDGIESLTQRSTSTRCPGIKSQPIPARTMATRDSWSGNVLRCVSRLMLVESLIRCSVVGRYVSGPLCPTQRRRPDSGRSVSPPTALITLHRVNDSTPAGLAELRRVSGSRRALESGISRCMVLLYFFTKGGSE